jgi:hypothetical protein
MKQAAVRWRTSSSISWLSIGSVRQGRPSSRPATAAELVGLQPLPHQLVVLGIERHQDTLTGQIGADVVGRPNALVYT